MSLDEERRALARARREAGEADAALALREARGLLRAGEVVAAERLLVAALDERPGQPDLTAALDELGGGRALGAPWPSPRGDARRTGRSSGVGPTRGRVVARFDLTLEAPTDDVAVEASGAALLLTASGLYRLAAGSGEVDLVATVPHQHRLHQIVLLPAGRIALVGNGATLVLDPIEGSPGSYRKVAHRHPRASSFALGPSGLLVCATRAGRLDAIPLARPAEAVTFHRAPAEAKTLVATAPGGELVLVSSGEARAFRPARVVRLTSAGEPRSALDLEALGFGLGVHGPVVGPDGTVFLGLGGRKVVAASASGERVFDVEAGGEPAALAGRDADRLVVREERGLALHDVRSGRALAALGEAFFGLPKVDARGIVYARRGDDLIGWDPASPGALAFELRSVAARSWDFVLAGGARALVWSRPAAGSSEVLVVE